jgi:hypothetical protein
LKRKKRDLKMEREVHGHPPSVIFEDRAEMYIDVPAIPHSGTGRNAGTDTQHRRGSYPPTE